MELVAYLSMVNTLMLQLKIETLNFAYIDVDYHDSIKNYDITLNPTYMMLFPPFICQNIVSTLVEQSIIVEISSIKIAI